MLESEIRQRMCYRVRFEYRNSDDASVTRVTSNA
jgi:hypothetical protein